jgi:hypothetical protein
MPASATTYSEPGYWYSSTTAPFGSGAVWISSQATTEGGYGNQWRLYKIDFDIPEGSTVTSARLWYTADNAVTVYLNDEEIGSTGYVYGTSTDGGYIFNKAYTVNFTPTAGSNTLKFVVRNWPHIADNPTGLLYRGQVVFANGTVPVQEPEKLIKQIIVTINRLDNIPPIYRKSLIRPLKDAKRSLQQDKDKAAIRQLNTFIGNVQALNGKKIPHNKAVQMIAKAKAIKRII